MTHETPEHPLSESHAVGRRVDDLEHGQDALEVALTVLLIAMQPNERNRAKALIAHLQQGHPGPRDATDTLLSKMATIIEKVDPTDANR